MNRVQRYFFRTRATTSNSRKLVKAVMAVLSEFLQDEDILYSLDLALTEACFNAARHAYDQGMEGDVEVALSVDCQRSLVRFAVSDWGRGVPGKDYALPVDTAVSGRGFFIIAQVADKVKWIRRKNKKSCVFSKQISEGLWKKCV